MGGYVGDEFAVDIHLAAVADALNVLMSTACHGVPLSLFRVNYPCEPVKTLSFRYLWRFMVLKKPHKRNLRCGDIHLVRKPKSVLYLRTARLVVERLAGGVHFCRGG